MTIVDLLVEEDDQKRFAVIVVLRNPDDPETLLVLRGVEPEKGKLACPADMRRQRRI